MITAGAQYHIFTTSTLMFTVYLFTANVMFFYWSDSLNGLAPVTAVEVLSSPAAGAPLWFCPHRTEWPFIFSPVCLFDFSRHLQVVHIRKLNRGDAGTNWHTVSFLNINTHYVPACSWQAVLTMLVNVALINRWGVRLGLTAATDGDLFLYCDEKQREVRRSTKAKKQR